MVGDVIMIIYKNTLLFVIKVIFDFFVYLHEKHTKILDLNLEKQGRIVKSQKKKENIYIHKKTMK